MIMARLHDITLQEMIENIGIKQKEIAKRLNLHESTISLKVTGKREMSIEEAGIIAEMLKTTSDQIRHALNFANRKELVSSNIQADNQQSATTDEPNPAV